MRVRIAPLAAIVLGVSATPVHAQTEWDLKQAFEGKFAVVKMDMPASHLGVDLYPDRQPSVDFRLYSARVREFGVALRPGDRIMITTVRVKKKNIEFQLGGGGYGVLGDDSGSVYVPDENKSRREKDLEKWIKDERDPERRRRMQRELDDLRRDRERENRKRDAEERDLTARKQSEIASKRLDAGSRFNLWFDEFRLASRVPTPREMRLMLAQFIDFEEGPGARPDMRTEARPVRAAAAGAARRSVARQRAAPRHVDDRRARHARRPDPQQGRQAGRADDGHRVVRGRRSRHRGRLRRQRDRPLLHGLEVAGTRPQPSLR